MNILSNILRELSYRITTGIPDLTNIDHLEELANVFSEFGIPETILTEEEYNGKYKLPVLNRMISYRNINGIRTQGRLGDLLRVRRGHPARIEAERALPDSINRDEVNHEIGMYGKPMLKTEEDASNEDSKPTDDASIDDILSQMGDSDESSDVDDAESSTTSPESTKPESDTGTEPDTDPEPDTSDETPDEKVDAPKSDISDDDTSDASEDEPDEEPEKKDPTMKYDKILRSLLTREVDIIDQIAQDPLRYYK
jgi:hypothetical protein